LVKLEKYGFLLKELNDKLKNSTLKRIEKAKEKLGLSLPEKSS
jgi:hypothetical protein